MKKLFWPIVCFVVMGFAVSSVISGAPASGCAAPRDNFDNLYCLTRVYVQVDTELNGAYKQLRSALNPAGRESLKRYQLDWIEQRNAECSYSNGTGFFVNMRCVVDSTSERLQFLRERRSECRSVGCINRNLR
jgi:uncharacterized protein YecT (DUF1311 family)